MLFRIFTLVLGALLLSAPFASATDDDRSSTRVVVIGDDGERATLTIDGGRLQVVASEDGETSVHEFDFSQLGGIIDGAVAAAMANLDVVLDEELSVLVDDDHMLHVSHGDRACAVNMEVLAHELQSTLANLQVQLGRELHHAGMVYDHHEQDDTDDLRAELDQLKAELEKLRGDLDRVR